MDTAIEIRGLTKRFGGKNAVDTLTLSIPRGAVLALLGDNGAGKTTTLRMLTGLLKPDAGSATILRHDCWKHAAALRHVLGYVPEKPKFYDWMTVDEIGWFTAGFHKPNFQARYRELADAFRLDSRAQLRQLSKGQYAKVGLALALAPDPEVLLLDEPTSGLDLMVRREFLSSLVGLAESGKTVVISSHQIAEVERIASHVAFVSAGRLLLVATTDQLRERVVRLRLRFHDQPPDPAFLGKVLAHDGAGKLWQAVIQDPRRESLEALRTREGIFDFEESSIGLEEVYTAVLGKEGHE
jgi:ABC-2 type transport system ATP-binding protein